MGIHVKNISKSFGDYKALNNVSLEVQSGELIALLGPSGSGKTSLLRIIAGLEQPDSGLVMLDGKPVNDKSVRQRQVGFVFQHYALFKHMSVFENVAFGLRVRPKHLRPSDAQIRRKVMELLEMVHLSAFHARFPHQLSGGQRQRVALARALAVEPKLLLLDEPFGALDAKVRKELRRWMRRLHDEIHITSIFVTHDQEEAMEVADRIVVMSNGKIEQSGTPGDVWNQPANAFVYDFLGNYNEFDGWKDADGNVHLSEYDVVETMPEKKLRSDGILQGWPQARRLIGQFVPSLVPSAAEEEISIRKVNLRRGEGKPIKLYARPHEMFVATEPDGHEYISARIIHINPAGSLVKLELERRNGTLLQAEISSDAMAQLKLAKHQDVMVRPKKTRIFE